MTNCLDPNKIQTFVWSRPYEHEHAGRFRDRAIDSYNPPETSLDRFIDTILSWSVARGNGVKSEALHVPRGVRTM